MNICMIVHNCGTRDGRVMREAHSLQAAGHVVTVMGIPEPKGPEPIERLSDGVTIIRVNWYPRARRRLLVSGIPRAILFVAVFAGIAYAIYRLANLTVRQVRMGPPSPWAVLLAALGIAAAAALGFLLARVVSHRKRRQESVRRQMISPEGSVSGNTRFPAIRSRIPDWLPDWVLEIAVEPLDWFGAKTGKFSMYRYRSEELAAAAIKLTPDVVHCHDCIALPSGWLVKKALGIPLVYDAHEIYEAVAARRFGATDYFARVHRRYLPRIDGFVAVNESAANYYAHAYPAVPRAVVIRNATTEVISGEYDGRLHRAAGLPRDEKILLYQGGFTRHRGLPTLLRAAPLLPDGWSLVMMGWGPLSEELQDIANKATGTAPSKAHFVPAVPAAELLSWTQGATAGIVPYEDKMLNHWIATPNKLWEYPAAGVPLIVQPFPEMRQIVERYRCGWVLPSEFSEFAIAQVVASLTDEMIAEARAGCSRFIEADSWPTVYRGRLLQLYERLAVQARNSPAAGSLTAHHGAA